MHGVVVVVVIVAAERREIGQQNQIKCFSKKTSLTPIPLILQIIIVFPEIIFVGALPGALGLSNTEYVNSSVSRFCQKLLRKFPNTVGHTTAAVQPE